MKRYSELPLHFNDKYTNHANNEIDDLYYYYFSSLEKQLTDLQSYVTYLNKSEHLKNLKQNVSRMCM